MTPAIPVAKGPAVRSSDRRLLATAFHEAGHAVQSVLEGVAVRSASIVPGEGYAGRVVHYPWCPIVQVRRTWAKRAKRRGRILLAGHAAQVRHAPRSVRSYHARLDREMAADLAMAISASDRKAEVWLRLWSVQAEESIALRWDVVEAVARALMSSRTLSGAQVRTIVLGGC